MFLISTSYLERFIFSSVHLRSRSHASLSTRSYFLMFFILFMMSIAISFLSTLSVITRKNKKQKTRTLHSSFKPHDLVVGAVNIASSAPFVLNILMAYSRFLKCQRADISCLAINNVERPPPGSWKLNSNKMLQKWVTLGESCEAVFSSQIQF